jgi:hypothetical protein
MIAGGDRRTEGLGWTCPGEANSLIVGVRSPPLRGGLAQHGWPSGGRSEMTRRWFSRRGAVSASAKYGRTQTGA